MTNKPLASRNSGNFYTHQRIGLFINDQIIQLIKARHRNIISIIDPFAGDGRLICWLIESAQRSGVDAFWKITLWDQNEAALREAKIRIDAMRHRTNAAIELSISCTNTFIHAQGHSEKFDMVITNPPWEGLKPDRRELGGLSEVGREKHIHMLKALDQKLAKIYPNSQPIKKFAGWGTNLSRVGLELSIQLLRPGGELAIVLPSSTFADQVSSPLRRWVVENTAIQSIGYFPAEARLFEHVDQASMVFTGVKVPKAKQSFPVYSFDHNSSSYDMQRLTFSADTWSASDYCIPFAIRGDAQGFLDSVLSFPTWGELEKSNDQFWAGRELDETGLEAKLSSSGTYRFVKGRMVGRFQLVEPVTKRIVSKDVPVPSTADMYRIAWRDVSRPTQRRRMQATVICPGYVTGNSLNIALFKNQDEHAALALLAIMNSLVFEIQVRMRSSTSHISLGVTRGVRLPDIGNRKIAKNLSFIAAQCLKNPRDHESILEVIVAKAYGLSKDAFESLLTSFPKINSKDAESILGCQAW
jgi:Alw26I/Eco31I/Esp3I family type II restriction m6 adenine DNA methyltransferase